MARQLAHINPRMLVWARKKSGRAPDHIAAHLRIPVERYVAWEAGEELPTLPKMRAVARLLKRPLALFYLEAPPNDFSPISDFRTLPGTPVLSQSAELLLAIRRAHFKRSVAIELAEDLDEAISGPDFGLGGARISASDFASRLRQWLGIRIEDQFAWRDWYEAKQTWQDKIEERGILVFQAEGVSTEEMRGFCIADLPLPVIVTNSSDSPSARIFTMIHELCHVLQSQTGICNPTYVDPDNLGEAYCNRVAGETLVPPDILLQEASAAGLEDWSDEELRRLSNRFSVSREVVLRRLLDLERTTSAFYENRRARFNREYRDFKERQKTADSFPRDMARLAKSNLGPSYVRLVLTAMRSEIISLRDASEYLGIKTKHFDRLEELVWQ